MNRDELKRHAFTVAEIALDNVLKEHIIKYLEQVLPDSETLAFDELFEIAGEVQNTLEEGRFTMEWDDDDCRRDCPGH
jgi:hypothetical protein